MMGNRTRRWVLLRDGSVLVGLLLFAFVLIIALFGRFLSDHSPTASVGLPGTTGDGNHLLGLDFQGRDVLARVLNGGVSTLSLATSASILVYFLGISFGLVAGYSRSLIDPLLMRTVDVILSIPSLLLMLLFVAGLGNSRPVMVVAAAVVMFPGAARIVRSATLEISTRGFVEAAVARGESTIATLWREVLPNIVPPIAADMGLRFSWSIILIASVNFLGLGIRPPTPDWGLMISENLVILSSNALAVVAPAVMIGLWIIGVNLICDGILRTLSRGAR
jgi:ABC-type dipeptide/oligopeptide/nickel transport system permease subunit